MLLTVGLAAYNLVGLGLLTARAARQGGGLTRTLRAQPRRYGAYTAHVGLVVLALGLAFSGAYRRDAQTTLNLQAAPSTLLSERLQLTGLRQEDRGFGSSAVATVQIDGRPFETRLNTYVQAPGTLFPAPAVRYGALGDTYLVVTSIDPAGKWASVRLIESPLVSWIWWGTLIICLGAGLTLAQPARSLPHRSAVRLAPATD